MNDDAAAERHSCMYVCTYVRTSKVYAVTSEGLSRSWADWIATDLPTYLTNPPALLHRVQGVVWCGVPLRCPAGNGLPRFIIRARRGSVFGVGG